MIDSNVTGIANAARKIPITASLQSHESERRQKRAGQVLLRAGEDHAALLRLGPELLHLPPEDAAEEHEQHDDARERSRSIATGCSEMLPRFSSNEPGTERKR